MSHTITIQVPNPDFEVYELEPGQEEAPEEIELVLPAKWEICNACGGEGTELYGSLKGADVTEMLREDPEFEEEYRGGRYDVACSQCHGTGKELVVDEDRLTAEQKITYHNYLDYQYESARQDAADARTRWQEGGWAER